MSWAVVYTHPKQEDRVVENLTRQGFSAWAPNMEVTKRRQNRFENRQEVLFSNYVFADLRPKQVWTPINSTYGARYLLCEGHFPRFLPDVLWSSCLGSGNLLWIIRITLKPPLKEGEEVKLVRGPFVGLVSKITDLLPGERVQILFDVLGQTVPTILPEKLLIKNC